VEDPPRPGEKVTYAIIENVRYVERVGDHPDGTYEERRDRSITIAQLRGHRGKVVEKTYYEYTCEKCGLTARIEKEANPDAPGMTGSVFRELCRGRHIP
jgi:hypothetical protein